MGEMTRRNFVREAFGRGSTGAVALAVFGAASPRTLGEGRAAATDAIKKDRLERWETYILSGARKRYCDTETGEQVGWLISPFLNGFYYGYRPPGTPNGRTCWWTGRTPGSSAA